MEEEEEEIMQLQLVAFVWRMSEYVLKHLVHGVTANTHIWSMTNAMDVESPSTWQLFLSLHVSSDPPSAGILAVASFLLNGATI